jgi:hypothetical protein
VIKAWHTLSSEDIDQLFKDDSQNHGLNIRHHNCSPKHDFAVQKSSESHGLVEKICGQG